MDQLAILRKLTDEAGALVRAHERGLDGDSPDFVVGVTLHFEQSSFSFDAQPDDDTLTLTLSPPPESSHTLVSRAERGLWAPVCGSRCCWAWLLTNQQGYTDGVRLEFATEPRATFVEFVVSASVIRSAFFHAQA